MSLFYKFINLLSNYIITVKENLSIIIHPLEIQILDPYILPVIRNLETRSIYNVSDFIGSDEFIILSCNLVSNKKTISHFHGS